MAQAVRVDPHLSPRKGESAIDAQKEDGAGWKPSPRRNVVHIAC